MKSLKIRPAQPDDLEAVLGVNSEAQSSALPQGWLKDPSGCADARRLLLVAESAEGSIDAFCLATLVLDEASLLLIAVRARARRQGRGRTLLRALLDSLGPLGINRCLLEVRESNTAALALYQRCGFARDGRRRGYYPPEVNEEREDAILMSWTRKVEDHGCA
ncbi:MAG: GNAT family N-acetyltransferase [Chromatocurvus sp.]